MGKEEDPLLKISEFSVAFQKRKVLDQLNLKVNAGEIVGLIGESGAGKTLTALAILGLLPDDSTVLGGEIRYQGRDLLRLDKEELRDLRGCKVGLVLQDPRTALNPLMRIDKQMCEGMRCRLGYGKRAALAECAVLLREVGIQDPDRCLLAYPHQLSGGMRQRVLVATALSCKPRLLICDEITSSVDSIVQRQVLTLLVRIRDERNVSILLITHNLRPLRHIADRISVLLRGKVVEEGAADEVFERPAHDFTRSLIASLGSLEEQ